MGVRIAVCAAVVLLVLTFLSSVKGNCRFNPLGIYSQTTVQDVGHDDSPRYLCFSDTRSRCWCSASVLDCSNNNGSLTFVPRVNGTFHTLNFTFNKLESVTEDWFLNVTNITVVDLSRNKDLSFIHPQAFKPLQNLTKLLLNYDYSLTYSILAPVFSIPTLTHLYIDVGDLGPPPYGLFTDRLPLLQTLYLQFNDVRRLSMKVLRPLKSLREFFADNNGLSYVDPGYAGSLEILHLRYNRLGKYFPYTCVRNTNTSLYPSLKQLFLMDNRISCLIQPVCLPSLEFLELSRNAITVYKAGAFSPKYFPNLQQLYLQHIKQYFHPLVMEAGAFSNPTLETISLISNDWLFDGPDVSSDSFKGCSGVKNFLVGYNTVSNNKFIQLTRDMKNLQYVHLGHNIMQKITMDTFAAFSNLSTICLYENQVTDLPDGVFDHLHNLTILQMGRNSLQTVRPTTFSQELQQRLHHLDLSENPFHCDCDILWFRLLLISRPELFNDSYGPYTCQGGPSSASTNLTTFTMALQACLLSHDVSVFIIVVIVLTIGGGMVVATLFRYRWHIRLILHETFRPQGWGAHRRQRADDFDYDVFVSYANEDLPWVRKHLMPELEGRQGLRLCIHQRDFIPGMYIVDNIVLSVKTSRKILMIFSDSFARSPWCQFELALCLDHVIHTDDALVVVRLQTVASRHLTLPMMAVFHTTTYIEWEDDTEAISSFWGRLDLALTELRVGWSRRPIGGGSDRVCRHCGAESRF